jgi:hypothetical protein
MLSKPFAGWSSFSIDEAFTFAFSYVEDTPQHLIDAFLSLLTHQCKAAVVVLDGEGLECIVVFQPGDCYVLVDMTVDMTKPRLVSQMFWRELEDLVSEFIQDLERDWTDWCDWQSFEDVQKTYDLTALKMALVEYTRRRGGSIQKGTT